MKHHVDGPMTDSLRTRIAAVIRREVPCHPPAADRIADAVIRELKLARRSGWTEDGHKKAHRYVTEWENDD